MKFSFAILFIFTIACCINAQTVLFNSYCADSPDDFSFFSTHAIDSGTQVYLSDANLHLEQMNFQPNSEGLFQWTADSVYPAGSIIHIHKTNGANVGILNSIENRYNLALSNDIIWAYQKSDNGQVQLLGALATEGNKVDSILRGSGLESWQYMIVSEDNGQYTGQRQIKQSELSNFYAKSNWTFSAEVNNDSCNAILDPICIIPEAPQTAIKNIFPSLELSINKSLGSTKTIVCVMENEITATSMGEQFHLPDTTITQIVDSACINLDIVAPGKTYHIRAASFSPFHNAILLSDELIYTAPTTINNQLSGFPHDWLGDTVCYFADSSGLTSNKSERFAFTGKSIDAIDAIHISLNSWDFALSNQNYFGILLWGNTILKDKPTTGYWNGYYLRFGSNGAANITINRKDGASNREEIHLGTIDQNKLAIENASLEISIQYSSNAKLKIELYYDSRNGKQQIGKCEIPVDYEEAKYWGIFTNFNNINPETNIKFKSIHSAKYQNKYQFIENGDFNDPESWKPHRQFSFRSDVLEVQDADSLGINAPSILFSSLELQNSNLYLVNNGAAEQTFCITDSLIVDQSSHLHLTNTESSSSGIVVKLLDSAYANIAGKISISAQGLIPNHRICAKQDSAIKFCGNAILEVVKQDGSIFHSDSAKTIAIFTDTSFFIQHDGASPMGNNPQTPTTIFEQGSAYIYYGGGLSFGNYSYPQLQLAHKGTKLFMMGNNQTCQIGELFIAEGNYRFLYSANNKSGNISITESLSIDTACSLEFVPHSSEANSYIEFAGRKVDISGKGKLHIGEHGTLKISSPWANLKTETDIAGKLLFEDNAFIYLDSAHLHLNGNIINAGSNCFIIVPETLADSTAYVYGTAFHSGTDTLFFPIGTDKDNYTPMKIWDNTGETAEFKVRVFNGHYQHGLYGEETNSLSGLQKTWEITPNGKPKVNIQIGWSEQDEASDFYRSYASMTINHHRLNNDSWHKLDSSIYSVENGLYTLRAYSIDDFSTVSAEGIGSELGLYIDGLTANQSKQLNIEWLQLQYCDSAIICTSPEGLKYMEQKTIRQLQPGQINESLAPVAHKYLTLKMYKNMKMVESVIITIDAEEIHQNPDIYILPDRILINKGAQTALQTSWWTTSGESIKKEAVPIGKTSAELLIPAFCAPCILNIKSKGYSESYKIINRELGFQSR